MNMRTFSLGVCIAILFLLSLYGLFLSAQAQLDNITFPIPSLGNCESLDACEAYCAEPDHADACLAWAEAQGIVVEVEPVEVSFEDAPGGCRSERECVTYCDNPEHFQECIEFAERKGLISSEEAAAAHGEGTFETKAGPGGCASEIECEVYCREPDHQLGCISYAEAEGFMTAAEAAKARKLLERGGQEFSGPGGCGSQESCEIYCSDSSHTRECILFAVEEGHMTQEEANRFLQFLEGAPLDIQVPQGPRVPRSPRGPVEPEIDKVKVEKLLAEQDGPGGCKSFQECDAFCSAPENGETCFEYAVEHGLIGSADAERLQKVMKAEGPGGCRGRQCETYCEEPGNESACLDFARNNGLIGDEDYREMKKFVDAAAAGGPGGCRGRQCETYCDDPAHRSECLSFAKQHALIPEEELVAMERIDQKMQESGGPGGCRSENECKTYCQDPSRFDECAAFAVDVGLIAPDQARQMLRQFIEVEQYGPQGFGPPGFGPGGPGGGFGPPPGFGPGGPGGFGPEGFGAGGVPPGFEGVADAEFQRQFEERFQQFEGYQQFFQSGQPPPGFGPPPGFEGQFPSHGEFPGSGGFPGGAGLPSASGGAPISIMRKGDGGFDLFITHSAGIQEFSLGSVRGARYGGALNGCPREYSSSITVLASDFPMDAFVIDCNNERHDVAVSSPFQQGQTPVGPDGSLPQEGGYPGVFPGGSLPSGATTGDIEAEIQRQFEAEAHTQYEQQYQQQYEQQYQQQYQQETGQYPAPSGSQQYPTSPYPSSGTSGTYDQTQPQQQPPPDYQQPSGTTQPPPSGTTTSPPPGAGSLLQSILQFFGF